MNEVIEFITALSYKSTKKHAIKVVVENLFRQYSIILSKLVRVDSKLKEEHYEKIKRLIFI